VRPSLAATCASTDCAFLRLASLPSTPSKTTLAPGTAQAKHLLHEPPVQRLAASPAMPAAAPKAA
jgi:hypothetical protein